MYGFSSVTTHSAQIRKNLNEESPEKNTRRKTQRQTIEMMRK